MDRLHIKDKEHKNPHFLLYLGVLSASKSPTLWPHHQDALTLMWKLAGSQGSVCQSLGWCRYQLQVPPWSISTTMAWLSGFQWKQMSTLSLWRTYGTQSLAAESYFIMSSNLPLWSELGVWKGRGQLSGSVAWVPHIVPGPAWKCLFSECISASCFKKEGVGGELR